jgi:hypothetical protein
MSTKYLLTLLLMELTEELRRKDLRLDLEWVRREDNVDADDLSNENWSNFSAHMRDERRPEEIGWIVLDRLQRKGLELYREIQELKEQRSVRKNEKTAMGKPKAVGKVLAKW